MLRKLEHPNIIRLYYFEHTEDFTYIVLERCACNVREFLNVLRAQLPRFKHLRQSLMNGLTQKERKRYDQYSKGFKNEIKITE